MKATDPAATGLWDHRGGKVGLDMEPFQKVSHKRCRLRGCETQWGQAWPLCVIKQVIQPLCSWIASLVK